MPVEAGQFSRGYGVITGFPSNGGGVPKLVEGAKLAFVSMLRAAFSSSFTNEHLRYSEDEKRTKIKIYTAHPLRLEFAPCLIVSVAGGDCSFQYMNDDYIKQDQTKSEYYYGGKLVFNINVTIVSRHTVERERLIDHLIFFLRHIFIGGIRGFNISYGKDMRLGSENIEEVENKPVYTQTLDIPCYLEYQGVISQNLLETLRAIDVTIPIDIPE
jgi:hypothetical protein